MNKTNEIQVNILIKWVNVRLAPSETQGVGVFAIKDIPEGTKLYLDIMPEIFKLDEKTLRNNVPEYIKNMILERWPLAVKGSAFVYPDCRFVAYMNHSDSPNYNAKEDVTIRKIEAGEEIFEDYRLIDGWEDIYPFLKD